jgi:hypothetical protein
MLRFNPTKNAFFDKPGTTVNFIKYSKSSHVNPILFI